MCVFIVLFIIVHSNLMVVAFLFVNLSIFGIIIEVLILFSFISYGYVFY